MSVSYAVDFASLLLLGPAQTTIIAVTSAWSQCTFRMQQATSAYRTLFSMACLAITVQAAGWVYLRLGGRPACSTSRSPSRPAALVGAATTYFLFNTVLISVAIALSTRQPWLRTWNENFLWSAPSYFVGAAAAFVTGWAVLQQGPWLALFIFAPLYLTYRTYKVYLGRIEDERRHVQEMSDLHLATIEALALAIDAKDQTAQSHIRRVQVYAAGIAKALGMPDQRDSGGEDRGPAPRHRQAGGARAHPVEARSAHPGRVPEDPHPPAGGRRNHQRGAVPLPGRAAHPQPPRALGRQGLSAGTQGRRDPARRAHPLGGGLLRRAHLRSPLPPGHGARRGAVAARTGSRQGARPGGGGDVLRAPAGAGGRGRPARSRCRRGASPSSRPRNWAGRRSASSTKAAVAARCSRTSRSRTARSTRSTRSRSRWAPASASPTPWRSSARS